MAPPLNPGGGAALSEGLRIIAFAEVEKHNKHDDAWMVVHQKGERGRAPPRSRISI